MKAIARFLVLSAACLFFVRPGMGQDDLSVLRDSTLGFLTARGGSTQDSLFSRAVSGLGSSAVALAGSIRADGSWSDISYDTQPGGSWGVGEHFRRIEVLAKAYRTQGQPLFGVDSVRILVQRALQYGGRYYHTGISAFSVALGAQGNWWWWFIGVPSCLGPTLLLMEDAIDSTTFTSSRSALGAFTAPMGLFPTPLATGQNLVDISLAHLYHALLTRDSSRVLQIRSVLAGTCNFTEAEGLQDDFSFHQHGPLLCTGSYGADFAYDLAWYCRIAGGTKYQLPQDALTRFGAYVTEGIAWGITGNYFDPLIIGRSISREFTDAGGALASLSLMAGVEGAHRQSCVGAATALLRTWDRGLPPEIAALTGSANSSASQPILPQGHKHFNRSDYTIHRAPGFIASVKMLSSRTRATDEYLNGEGKRSWHLSDGATLIDLDGGDYYRDHIRATMDWQRVPGTTVERIMKQPGEGYGTGRRTFVGGAWTGTKGVCAMDFAANASKLTGKKSWFFFDDIVVCAGSSIACSSSATVETIVDQRPLSSPAQVILVDGVAVQEQGTDSLDISGTRWIHCGGTGYIMHQSERLRLMRKVQSGAWSDLGTGSSTLHQQPFMTLLVDHGVGPSSASYCYTLLPGKSAQQTDSLAQADGIAVEMIDSRVHHLRDSRTRTSGIVFWAAGTSGVVSVNQPCVVVHQRSDSAFSLALSNPDHADRTIVLAIALRLREISLSPGMAVVGASDTTIINVTTSAGRNYTLSARIGQANPVSWHRRNLDDRRIRIEARGRDIRVSVSGISGSGPMRAYILSPQGRRVLCLTASDKVASPDRRSFARVNGSSVSLPPGTYLLRVDGPDGGAVRKFVVR